MCGIAGFSAARGDHFDRIGLTRALLAEIESRGRDASGVAWRTASDGETWYHKEPVPGSRLPIDETIADAAAAVIHTRWATQGSPKRNENNHPIIRPNVVGVHNGCIRNDDEIFAMIGGEGDRVGEVDSEAIFALVEVLPALGGQHQIGEALELISGSMAAAWLPLDARELWLTRGASSPLFVTFTVGGSLVFASTEGALRRAMRAAGCPVSPRQRVFEIGTGVVFRVVGGKVVDRWEYEPDGGGAKSRHDYGVRSQFEVARQKQGTKPGKPKPKPRPKNDDDDPYAHLPNGTVVRRWVDSTRLDDEVYVDTFKPSDRGGRESIDDALRCRVPGCENRGVIKAECHDHWRERVRAEQAAAREERARERRRQGRPQDGTKQKQETR